MEHPDCVTPEGRDRVEYLIIWQPLIAELTYGGSGNTYVDVDPVETVSTPGDVVPVMPILLGHATVNVNVYEDPMTKVAVAHDSIVGLNTLQIRLNVIVCSIALSNDIIPFVAVSCVPSIVPTILSKQTWASPLSQAPSNNGHY